jgi:sodium-dependent phosphate transporter
MLQIVISWFLSPIAAGVVCLIIFLLIRTVVLRRPNSTKIAFWVLPVLIIVTIWVVRLPAGYTVQTLKP